MSTPSLPWPTFAGPTHIPYERATRRLWGDKVSGEVADWIYVSSEKIHQMIFGLSPGGAFRHSERYRTLFAADEVLYVLSGTLLLSNPESGEVHRVCPEEAVCFRRDTWHHGFSHGPEPLRVLEFFAPPPSKGTSQAYARTKPNLLAPKYVQDQWLGRWPLAQAEAARAFTMRLLRESDILWRLEGQETQSLVGILFSTEYLTVGKIHLLSGQKTDVHTHGGDESLYLLEGSLSIRVPEGDWQTWSELRPGDGFYVPEGVPHQYSNISEQPAVVIFGVAPQYLPG
jgi:quercetin dioxygenase-like cupin family protein